MGIEYFSCDDCGCVMNDAGDDEYFEFQYMSGTKSIDGTFCDDCTKQIRADLTPCLEDYHVLFVLRTNNIESFYVLHDVDKESLKLLMENLKTADMAFCVGTFDHEKNIGDFWPTYEEINRDIAFEVPEKIYSFFLHTYLKRDDFNNTYSWFTAPRWPDVKTKKRDLQNMISRLENTVATIQHEIQVKKLKLAQLESDFP